MVYFECIFIANLVLLRQTSNYTGWGEIVLLCQVTSFFITVYTISRVLNMSVIAHFFDEFFSSWTAWLGCLFVASIIYLEKALVDGIKLLKSLDC